MPILTKTDPLRSRVILRVTTELRNLKEMKRRGRNKRRDWDKRSQVWERNDLKKIKSELPRERLNPMW